jgi:hypothetical protein
MQYTDLADSQLESFVYKASDCIYGFVCSDTSDIDLLSEGKSLLVDLINDLCRAYGLLWRYALLVSASLGLCG